VNLVNLIDMAAGAEFQGENFRYVINNEGQYCLAPNDDDVSETGKSFHKNGFVSNLNSNCSCICNDCYSKLKSLFSPYYLLIFRTSSAIQDHCSK
jgi:hypothetical protein